MNRTAGGDGAPRFVELACEAVVFDLDGVLVDSQQAVVAAWEAWRLRAELPDAVDESVFMGRRSQDVIADLAPHLDPESELAFFIEQEQHFSELVRPIDGAATLLACLPRTRWAIATSGSAASALRRLSVARLPVPAVLVTAETVARGKPDPEPYLAACRGLERRPSACVVFEDAPQGIDAARAAGCFAVGVASWTRAVRLETEVVVKALSHVDVLSTAPDLVLRLASVV